MVNTGIHDELILRRVTVQWFWSQVNVSPSRTHCWPWRASAPGQYGRFTIPNTPYIVSAHRAALILHTGQALGELCALHRCDNPPCCNPHCLWAGTNVDNIVDAYHKGHMPIAKMPVTKPLPVPPRMIASIPPALAAINVALKYHNRDILSSALAIKHANEHGGKWTAISLSAALRNEIPGNDKGTVIGPRNGYCRVSCTPEQRCRCYYRADVDTALKALTSAPLALEQPPEQGGSPVEHRRSTCSITVPSDLGCSALFRNRTALLGQQRYTA